MIKLKPDNKLLLISCIVAGVSATGGVFAQGTALLEEIIVTAQRRAESVQDVPIAINAFTGEQLKAVGIDSTLDIQLKVPGLHLEPLAGQGLAYLRGVGTDTLTPGLEPTTAVHIDGVYLPRLSSIISDFYDAERVEVIKGPQGTLFGRNATGGVIHFVSRKPEDELGGYLDVSGGNHATVRVEGALNTPISERAALRVAGLLHDNNGYSDNAFTGRDEDTTDVKSFRTQLLFRPTDAVSIRVFGDYLDDQSSRGTASHVSPPLSDNPYVAFSGGTVLADIRDTYRDVTANNETEAWGIGAEITWNLGSVEIKSLTSYREDENRYQVDFDLTEINAGGFNDPITDSEFFQQEFQLSSIGDGPLDWVVGAFLFDDEALHDYPFPFSFGQFAVGPTIGGTYDTVFIHGYSNLDTFAWALFGQASYRLNDHLRAHAGIRYSDEEKEIDFESYSFVPIVPAQTGPEYIADRLTPSGPPTVAHQDETDSDSVTPKFGIDFFLSEDVMIYFGATRGFKSGGYNTVLFGPLPEAVKPETIWSFEGGFKSTLADGKLRLNASAFYYDYKNIHQNVDLADNAQGYANVRNAGDAEVFGIEADMVLALTDRFVIDGMFSYLDTELKDLMAPDLNVPGNPSIDQRGNPLPRSPEFIFGFGAAYTMPMPAGDVTLRGDYYYMDDERYWSVFKDPLNSGDSYTRVNARLQFDHGSGKWSIAAYARNLFDEDAESNGFRSTTFGNLRTYQPPRTWGANVRYNF
ncbi:MAG: TonB-dependent receptor [Gammaproteobacteria bacterium]|nr:TonB-dependent receptor [Gammaproteobacteria bacterium]MDE0286668.1 TonB-dependent receptor [Gammaproteobacteria bacterium]